MKSIEKFLSELGQANVKIWSEEDRLHYKAPQSSVTQELLTQLQGRKSEILTYIEHSQAQKLGNKSTILPTPRTNQLPLSFAQQRLWFLHHLEPNSTAYHMPVAYRLTGHLNTSALEQSLLTIVKRHEILRTTFPSQEGHPYQLIHQHLSIPFPIINLQSLPTKEREISAQKLVQEHAEQSFDLTQGPLFRAQILQLSETDHILSLNIHHIIFDGWSFSTLYREITALYAGFINNIPAALSPIDIQYADYAYWQNQTFQNTSFDSQLNYWKRALAGSLSSLQLQADYPQPNTQSWIGSQQPLTIDAPLTQSLKSLCQQEGVTLFMLLLTVFQILLSRHTAQDDITVGAPIAGRHHIQTEPLIGLFLNNLALRTNLSGNPTFLQVLAQVRDTTLSAYDHQDLPFEKLVEVLNPERSLSHHPIFEVMLNVANTPQISFNLHGLTTTSFEVDIEPKSKFAITLYVKEQQGKLNFNLVYQKALFSDERMTCFLQQFQYFLQQVITDPNRPIHSYSLVTPQSQAVLPNPHLEISELAYDLVPQIFTTIASQTPNAIAISQDGTWTYHDLVSSALKISQHLNNHGLVKQDVVAISGTCSFGLIASMLGVLINGNVLLTLDQNLPLRRKQVMIAEAKAKCCLLIGDGDEVPNFATNSEVLKFLSINPNTGQPTYSEFTDAKKYIAPTLLPDDPAYIFFTSGTTGTPKGILGTHKGLAHFLHWQKNNFNIGPDDRCSQLTGFSFDVVLREVFLPLTSGATLCLPNPEDDLTPQCIIPWLIQQKITVLHTVPTLAQVWCQDDSFFPDFPNLRWIFFAGEPLSAELAHRWRNVLSEKGRIVNLYGPTETTLAKCFYLIPPDILSGTQPIGIPLPETQVLILSTKNQLCGIYENGEIVIRTPFRSKGYINRSSDHKKYFIRNPFRDDTTDILYRTGDIGHYRPDGTIGILGRLDKQVKIRGIRIELDEVKVAVLQHPAIQDAFITGGKDPLNNLCLIGYISFKDSQRLSIPHLRQFLIGILPKSMVPEYFIELESMPITANGKIDLHALPSPNFDIQEENQEDDLLQKEENDSLQNELISSLTKIWQEVLGIRDVKSTDNFFDIGGNSLKAIILFTRIEKFFGKKLPLSILFKANTISQLAEIISQEDWLAPWTTVVEVKGGARPPLFVASTLMEEPLAYLALANNLGSEQPVLGSLARTINGNLPADITIEDLASHYLSHLRAIQPSGPYYLAGSSKGGAIALEMAHQLKSCGEKVALLILFDSTGPDYPELLPLLPRFISVIKFICIYPAQQFLSKVNQILYKFWYEGFKDTLYKIFNKIRFKEENLTITDQIFERNFYNLKNMTNLFFSTCKKMPLLERWINLSIFYLLKGVDGLYGPNLRTFLRGILLKYSVTQPEQKKVYPGKVLYFRASQQSPCAQFDPKVGWGKVFYQNMDICEIPGSHRGILQYPNVKLLASKLELELQKAQSAQKLGS